jgi:hypothetical protein
MGKRTVSQVIVAARSSQFLEVPRGAHGAQPAQLFEGDAAPADRQSRVGRLALGVGDQPVELPRRLDFQPSIFPCVHNELVYVPVDFDSLEIQRQLPGRERGRGQYGGDRGRQLIGLFRLAPEATAAEHGVSR